MIPGLLIEAWLEIGERYRQTVSGLFNVVLGTHTFGARAMIGDAGGHAYLRSPESDQMCRDIQFVCKFKEVD